MLSQSAEFTHLIDEPFNLDNSLFPESQYVDRCIGNIDMIAAMQDGVLIKDNLSYIGSRYFATDTALQQAIARHQTHIKNNFYKIKLMRRNMFEQAMSNCIANLSDTWSYHIDVTPAAPMAVSVDMLSNMLDIYQTRRRYLVDYPDCDEVLFYEDLSNDVAKDWGLIQGVAAPASFSEMLSIPSPDKRTMVLNYDELHDWYQANKSRYEH